MKKRNYPLGVRTRRLKTGGLGALAAALFLCNAAAAADGDLDTTFGTGGFAVTGVATASFQLPAKPVVQPDGKILICSALVTGGPSNADFFIARFTADGALDNSFSFDGKVTVDFGTNNDICNALALQADGKIIAVGTTTPSAGSNGDFAVARLNADGSLDSSFGAGTGETTVPFDVGGSDLDIGDAVALQADGKILVSGWANTDTNGDDFAIVRLLPDGTRDTTFNSTGRVTVGFDFAAAATKTDQSDAVIVDDAGRIVVGGVAQTQSDSFDFAVIRLLPNGQLDHGFDADGRATIAFDLGDTISELSYQTILQRDGKIVMAGGTDTGSGSLNEDFAVARLLPDGSPDATFGIGGKVVVPFDLVTGGGDVATGLFEDSVGRIVLGGAATYDVSSDFRPAVARLLANGDLDESFGSFGKKTYDFGGTADLFTGIAQQGTQIIGFGETVSVSATDNVVARIEVDLIFANGFE